MYNGGNCADKDAENINDEDEDDNFKRDNHKRQKDKLQKGEIQYQLLSNGENNSLNSPVHTGENNNGNVNKTTTNDQNSILQLLPPPCRCPYFGDADSGKKVRVILIFFN